TTLYIGGTLALGAVFLVIKAIEYNAKFEHDILPGHVFDRLDGTSGEKYLDYVKKQLKKIVDEPDKAGASKKAVEDCRHLQAEMQTREINNALTPQAVMTRLQGSLKGGHGSAEETTGHEKALLDKHPDLPIKQVIPYGNLWTSCYFAMTGFHAL